MDMTAVRSTSVESAGYDPETGTLRVAFAGGGTYDYFGVPPWLFEEMLRPYPWRRVGQLVKAHPYRRLQN